MAERTSRAPTRPVSVLPSLFLDSWIKSHLPVEAFILSKYHGYSVSAAPCSRCHFTSAKLSSTTGPVGTKLMSKFSLRSPSMAGVGWHTPTLLGGEGIGKLVAVEGEEEIAAC